VRLDSGRTVAFNIKENLHLDYGYAVTSHSSQGQTADRVLVHVDTEQAGEKLVNRRLAYVAVSWGRYDAQLYTTDKAHLTDPSALAAVKGQASYDRDAGRNRVRGMKEGRKSERRESQRNKKWGTTRRTKRKKRTITVMVAMSMPTMMVMMVAMAVALVLLVPDCGQKKGETGSEGYATF